MKWSEWKELFEKLQIPDDMEVGIHVDMNSVSKDVIVDMFKGVNFLGTKYTDIDESFDYKNSTVIIIN